MSKVPICLLLIYLVKYKICIRHYLDKSKHWLLRFKTSSQLKNKNKNLGQHCNKGKNRVPIRYRRVFTAETHIPITIPLTTIK